MKPELTVLLPNYNNGPYLKECMESLLNQTFQNFVIFFVDDCSTDNSIEEVEKFDDSRIKLFRKEKQSGIVDTLNHGLKEVETPYFIRMDGDDIATPERFEIMVNFMKENPDIDVCGSSIKAFGTRNELQTYGSSSAENKARLIFGHAIGHASCIFRTGTLKKHGVLYQDNFWRLEDYDLFYRIKDIAKTTSVKDVLYLYRQEHYNLNPEIEKRKKQEYIRLYKRILMDLSEEFNDEDVQIHLELARKDTAAHDLNAYKSHVQKIIRANDQKKNFPANELNQVLNEYLDQLIFRLIENKKIGLVRTFMMGLKNPAILRYYFGRRIKKST